jgi:hypothetical protein
MPTRNYYTLFTHGTFNPGIELWGNGGILDEEKNVLKLGNKKITCRDLKRGFNGCEFKSSEIIAFEDIEKLSNRYPEPDLLSVRLYFYNPSNGVYGIWEAKNGKTLIKLESNVDSLPNVDKEKLEAEEDLLYLLYSRLYTHLEDAKFPKQGWKKRSA